MPAEATAGRKGNGHLELLIFGPVNGSGDREKGVPMNLRVMTNTYFIAPWAQAHYQ